MLTIWTAVFYPLGTSLGCPSESEFYLHKEEGAAGRYSIHGQWLPFSGKKNYVTFKDHYTSFANIRGSDGMEILKCVLHIFFFF